MEEDAEVCVWGGGGGGCIQKGTHPILFGLKQTAKEQPRMKAHRTRQAPQWTPVLRMELHCELGSVVGSDFIGWGSKPCHRMQFTKLHIMRWSICE